MAEIHVQPKKGASNTTWIWIAVVLIIAAAVAYYLVTRNKTTNNAATPASTTSHIIQPSKALLNTVLL